MKTRTEILDDLLRAQTFIPPLNERYDDLVTKQSELGRSFFTGKISFNTYLKGKKRLNRVYSADSEKKQLQEG